jgi:phosphatidylcholine synthase
MSSSTTPVIAGPTGSQFRRAWSVHVFTASGIVVGMLALDAVLERRARAAMILLLITQLIDGIDGPMARAADVKGCVPRIDGYVMDLVIDFVTCVIVPAAFMHQFGLLPEGFSLILIGLIVFTSAIWFSRTDMMTDDHWFRGFPAVWNLVAPTLFLLHTSPITGAIVTVALAGMSLTNVPFPHPVRVVRWRTLTLPVTIIWLVSMTIVTLDRSPFDAPIPLRACLIAGPMYFFGLAAARSLGYGAAAPTPDVEPVPA